MSLGYSVSTAVGRVAAGETDNIWTPRSLRAGRCGVILVHGSGAWQGFMDPVAQPSSVKMAAALAWNGIPCIAGDFAGQAWGNDTVLARIDAAWAVLKAKFPTMRQDKVALLGGSMGGAAVARYAQLHPDRTAAVVGLIPLWDLKSFYAAQATTVRAEIASAWGVANGAALPAAADILANANAAKSVPHLMGYSTVDNIVLPPWSLNYATAVGATAVITDTTYGHSDQAIGGMAISTLARFLVANGA